MAGMRLPMVPDTPVQVLREEQIRTMLKVVEGRHFVSRRDNAIF